jgi:hypothetical protein
MGLLHFELPLQSGKYRISIRYKYLFHQDYNFLKYHTLCILFQKYIKDNLIYYKANKVKYIDQDNKIQSDKHYTVKD